ncbi:hypothetical protein B0H13DRAFT_1939066 [Mycena leptocephala]|nr:hypothetical protein B0H13DRAFT_1939066 [Mycena leptocephala]
MNSLNKPPKSASENSDPPYSKRKSTKRITSPIDDDASVTSGPPTKKPRLDGSDDEEPESSQAFRQATRNPTASNSRAKPKPSAKKRSKVVISDPESEEFDPVDEESEPEMPVEDDDEYMSEPKSTGKRTGGSKGKATKGGKGKKSRDPRTYGQRRAEAACGLERAGSSCSQASSHEAGPKIRRGYSRRCRGCSDCTCPTSPPREDAAPAPPKKKLPQIKKNKPAVASGASGTASSGAGTSTPSIPSKPGTVVARVEEDSKLPPPVVGAGARKATLPISADVDLSNPMMYAQLFKSGGGSTPSGFTRREKDEERRKELNRMRDEAKAKRVNEAVGSSNLPFLVLNACCSPHLSIYKDKWTR